MARPQKDTFDYFPHDTDAVSDEKIEAMRAMYGNDGYAFYFILLERIYKKNGVLDVKNTAIKAAIQRNITSDSDLFDKMLNTAFDIGLFDKSSFDEKGILTSAAIESRTASVNGERARKRAWAEKKTEKQKVLDVENSSNRRQLTHKVKGKVKDINTPISPNGEDNAFDTFWTAYPKKIGKAAAEQKFKKLNPNSELLTKMLKAIEVQSQSEQWKKDNLQYVPNASTWIHQKRWEDETKTAVSGTNDSWGGIPRL